MARRREWRRWQWLAVGLVCLSLTSAFAQQTSPAPHAPNDAADVATARQPARAGDTLVAPSTSGLPTPLVPNVQTDGTGQRLLPHDLSPWSMFLTADKLVQGVMLGLALASLVTWTIFIGKTFELGLARRRLRKALVRTDQVASLAEARVALGAQQGLIGILIANAIHELDAGRNASEAGMKERCASLFADIVRMETQSMRRGMGLLATIGSTAPFVGLFGTVWGIMNAFIGISKAQTTNLAVVAPGIAEALLATAIGLVAAIPAVIIYNHFSQATRRYQFLVGRASGVVQRLLSRELDSSHTRMTIRAAE